MEEELGRQVRREIADAFVVLRHFLNIALARDGDTILCSFKLTLKITEVLVGFQIGIILCNGDETAQCRGEASLRLLKLFESGRIF